MWKTELLLLPSFWSTIIRYFEVCRSSLLLQFVSLSFMSGNFHQPNKDRRSELFLLTELDLKSCRVMPVYSLAGRTHGQRLIKTRFLQNGADFPKCSDTVPLCSFSPPYPLWTGFIGSKLFQNFPQYILKRLGHLGKQPWNRWV